MAGPRLSAKAQSLRGLLPAGNLRAVNRWRIAGLIIVTLLAAWVVLRSCTPEEPPPPPVAPPTREAFHAARPLRLSVVAPPESEPELAWLEAELRSLAGTLAGARQRTELYESTVLPRRRRIMEAAQLNYNYMLLGPAHLLFARREEIAAQRAALEALRDYWIGRARLERALGTRLPTHPPAAQETSS